MGLGRAEVGRLIGKSAPSKTQSTGKSGPTLATPTEHLVAHLPPKVPPYKTSKELRGHRRRRQVKWDLPSAEATHGCE